MLLSVNKISKSFGDRNVLTDVDFQIGEGEIVGFLGPNGAGKTTTMKIILGLLKPDSGEVFIDGISVQKKFEKAAAKIGAFVETPEFYGYLSGRENLKIAGRPYGVSGERIEEMIDTVDMRAQIDEKVRRYSLGMRQRLGIAQALLHSPKLLILDEPLNGLDPLGVRDFRTLIRNTAKNGTSALISSHRLAEMEMLCDRVIILESGFITAQKKISEINSYMPDIPAHYILDVSDSQKAVKVLTEAGFSASSGKEGLDLWVTRLQSSRAVALLVEKNIAVYGMTPVKKTLSEAFMEKTENRGREKKK